MDVQRPVSTAGYRVQTVAFSCLGQSISWRYEMRYKLITVFVSVFLFAGSALAQEAKKDGWWIKVNTEKPASQMIGFYVGATGSSYGFWNVWNPKRPAEFDISQEYRNSPTLFILAQTTSGQKCGFCLMYKSKGVKYFEFDLEDSQEVKQSDEDRRCK
jgi:hypothetical protein